MKPPFDSIVLILAGLFGIIGGILGSGWGFGGMTNAYYKLDKDLRRFISIVIGATLLIIGLALLRKFYLHI